MFSYPCQRGGGQAVQAGLSCPPPAQDLSQALSSVNSYCTITLENSAVRVVNIISVKLRVKLQGHWWGFISQNYVVWPTFLLMNVFIALKRSHFWFLFDFTAAGVVLCGGRKTSPRTSSIVQFIFWSFEISDYILRNQKLMFRLIF